MRWREECKMLNPCWEFRLWTDGDNLDLVKMSFPELLPTYEGYDVNIKRIDAARYMMLYKYGGVYMDMDLACLRGFNESTFRKPNTFYAAQQHDMIGQAHRIVSKESQTPSWHHHLVTRSCPRFSKSYPQLWISMWCVQPARAS